MTTLLLVAIGGAGGALMRFGLGLLASNLLFPWGTLIINIAGCLAIGLCWSAFAHTEWFAAWGRALIVVGLLGGFTTFSAFSLETLQLVQNARLAAAASYVVASVLLCLLATFIGLRLGGSLGSGQSF
ncbi:MAG: fluoride efflux transporter CrcB [Pseudomonadota bacterium]